MKRILIVAFAIVLLLAVVGAAAQPMIQGIASQTLGSTRPGSTGTFTLTASGTASSQQVPGDSAATIKHPIGYVGCSNSADAVMGYYMNPDKGLLWKPYPTGGGSLDMWATPTSQYWTKFDQQVQMYGPPSAVWINVCERASRPLTFIGVKQTINILRQHAPAAKYYISPLNTYSPLGICKLTGPNGVQDTTNLANQAVANGLALRGPVLGPLTSQTLNPDLCHPNAAGEKLLGSQLSSFFDSGSPAPTQPPSTPTQPTSTSAQLTISANESALNATGGYYFLKFSVTGSQLQIGSDVYTVVGGYGGYKKNTTGSYLMLTAKLAPTQGQNIPNNPSGPEFGCIVKLFGRMVGGTLALQGGAMILPTMTSQSQKQYRLQLTGTISGLP